MANQQDHVKELKQEFVDRFGGDLTAEQLWSIVKLCKRVRLRARNNVAFNNLFNQLFPYANFRTVQKQGANGPYTGLAISVKDQQTGETNTVVEDDDNERHK